MKKITLLLLLLGVLAGHARNTSGGDDPECLTPVDLTVIDVALTSATVVWTESGAATAWEVLVVEMGAPAPTDGTSGYEAGMLPSYTVNSLVPCTHYSVYVRTNCGDAFSAWAGPLNFMTVASGAIGTFNENFETTAVNGMPSCWSTILNGDTLSEFASIKTVDSNPYEGTKALQMINHSSGNDSNIILVSPNLTTVTTGTHRLRFHARSGFNAGSLEIGTVDSATNEGQFTFLEAVDLTDDYAEYIINYDAYEGTDTYVALRHNSPLYNSIFIDNIVWEAAPLCADVSGIVINDTSTDSVTLSWTSNGDETAWDIVYSATSVTDPATLTPVSPAPATNNGAVVTGLAENTAYKLWVRSVCPDDVDGYWVGPVTFTTSCAPIAVFDQDFESTEADGLPVCWSAVLAGETLSETSYVHVFDGYAHAGTKSARLNNTDSGAAAKIMLVSPKLSTLSDATHRLRFWASGNGGATILDIGTLNNNSTDAEFTSFLPITLGEQYAEYIVEFTDYTGPDSYIAFRNTSTTDYTSIYIDDIEWEAIPSCADVVDVAILESTTTSAFVGWTAGNSETNWQVAYGPATLADPALGTISGILSDTSFEIEGLTAGSTYKIWVRSVCGEDNGNWIGPIILNSECNPTASFAENFESVVAPAFPVCWSSIVTGASSEAIVTVDPFSAGSAPNAMLLYGAYSGQGANIILITPPVTTLSAGNYVLKFDATGSHQLEIGTLDGNTNEAVFTLFETVTPSDFNNATFTVDFSAYAGTDTYIGFRLKTNGDNAYASIDDISWAPNLSSGSFDKSQFRYHPNPVKDVLNIGYDESITNITVFNLLGQKVMENTAGSTSVRLDMSTLSSGSYIVKVASDDQVRSIKVIKQ